MGISEEVIRAINDRCRIRLVHDGLVRIVEPYLLYETQAGTDMLHGLQTGGQSKKPRDPHWCNLRLEDVTEVSMDGHYSEPHPEYNPDSPQFHHVIVATPKGPATNSARG